MPIHPYQVVGHTLVHHPWPMPMNSLIEAKAFVSKWGGQIQPV